LKKIIFFLILIVILIIGFSPYIFSSSMNKVFPHVEKISHLDFGDYINEGEVELFTVQIKETREIERIKDILSSASYTRSIGNKLIRNDAISIRFTVFYIDNNGKIDNYEVIMNNQGYLLSNNKKFRVNEDKVGEVFNQLSDYLIRGNK